MNLIRELKGGGGRLRQSQMEGIVGCSPEVWVRALSSPLFFFSLFSTPEGDAFSSSRLSLHQHPRPPGASFFFFFANVATNIHTLGGGGGRRREASPTAWKSRPNVFARLIDLLYGGGVGPTLSGLLLLAVLRIFGGCFRDGGTQLEIVD